MRYFLMIFFLMLAGGGIAQKSLKYDSASVVEQRSINTETYKQRSQFQYDKIMEPPRSLWDRFWSWFWRKIGAILSTSGGSKAFYIFLIVFGVAAIAFLVWKITGMNKAGLFARNGDGKLNFILGEDDIHNIDFNKEIEEAIAQGNYRLAVRLLYLQTLKLLSDKSIIHWQMDKTNTVYVTEMKGHPQQQPFAMLTNTFDYAWYGNTHIDQDTFNQANNSFKQFHQQLHY